MTENELSRVALIGCEEEENLSIRYLGGVLDERGNPVKIIPFTPREHSSVLKCISKFNPDLIGISIAFQSLAKDFFQLIEKIKKDGFEGHLTVGGHFPTFEYKKILNKYSAVDSVVRFEGEKPIIQLSKALEGKIKLSEVNNLVYRKSGKIKENECINKFPDLDALPFPLRKKEPMKRMGERFATLVSSRGCWHSSCLYCCIGAYHKNKDKKHKLRSPENIAKEITKLYLEKGIKVFQFHDDNFLQQSEEKNVTRLKEIKAYLEEMGADPENLAFLIKARPDSLTRKVVSALKNFGVVGVFLGIENACEAGLKKLIRGSKMKDIFRAVDLLEEFEIPFTYNLLIFHPNTTLDEINKNIRFATENIRHPFDFGRAEIVAASPLESQVKNKELLKGNWPNWDYEISNEGVERLFKVYTQTFGRTDSKSPVLAHRLISLIYQAGVIKRLYPGPLSDEFMHKARDLISNSNRFMLDELLDVYGVASETVTKEKVYTLSQELEEGCENFLKEVNHLSRKMERLQIMERNLNQFKISSSFQDSKFLRKLLTI